MLLAAPLPIARDEHAEAFCHMMNVLSDSIDEYAAIAGEESGCILDETGTIADYRAKVLAEWGYLVSLGGGALASKGALAADIRLEPWKESMRAVAGCAGQMGSKHTHRAEQLVLQLARDLRRDQVIALGAGVLSFGLLSVGIGTVIVPTARRARRLAEAARLLSEGNRSVDCRVGGDDEIAEAGEALDRMRILTKAHESELGRREAESRELSAALDRAALTTLITDRHSLIVWSNRLASDARGLPLVTALRNARYDERDVRRAQEVLAAGGPFTCERTELGADGVRRWYHLDAYPVRDERDSLTNYVVIERDVSEARRLEFHRERYAGALAMLLSSASLEAVLDAFGRYLEEAIPGAMASVLGLEGTRLRHLAAPTLPIAYSRLIDGVEIGPDVGSCGRAAYLGEPVIVEDIPSHPAWVRYRGIAEAFGLRACWSFPCRAADGQMLGTLAVYTPTPRGPIAAERQILEIGAGFVSLALARQRSDQQNGLRSLELAEAKRELDRLQRDVAASAEAMKTRTASALREVHASLVGLARVGHERVPRTADELARCVDDLIALTAGAEAAGGTLRSWRSPVSTVRDAVLLLAPLGGVEAITVRIGLGDDDEARVPDLVLCDHERMRRALTQVLREALVAARVGPIEVCVGVETEEQPPHLHVIVRDASGPIGRGESELARIAIERGGGTLRTHPDRHVTVTQISLPCAGVHRSEDAQQNPEMRGASGPLGLEGLAQPESSLADAVRGLPRLSGRILVVDDHADNRALFALHLRRAGMTVEEAADGTEAMRAILSRAGSEPLRAVILDMQLPGIDGYNVARAVRSAGLTTPIIAATAHGMSDERARCMAAGCDDVVLKPVTREELLTGIERVLRRAAPTVPQGSARAHTAAVMESASRADLA